VLFLGSIAWAVILAPNRAEVNITMDKSILVLPGAFSHDYCRTVIDYFNQSLSLGLGINRQTDEGVSPLLKKDLSVAACQYWTETTLPGSTKLINRFKEIFWQNCYPEYVKVMPNISQLGPHTIYHYKIQRTSPGEGYHAWHSEIDKLRSARRILAWTLYLNTVAEGGETEFLYQHLRVKPVEGTLVIWPAHFTHAHRGNPPIGEDKYIVTGWVDFV